MTRILISKFIKRIAIILRHLPYWDKVVIHYCKVGKSKNKNTKIGQIVYFLFCKEYYSRPLGGRVNIQSLLGGGLAGAEWADLSILESLDDVKSLLPSNSKTI